MATLAESKRHSLASEAETSLHNRNTENWQNRSLVETTRHNYATEANQRYASDRSYQSAIYSADRHAEATRYSADRNAAASAYSAQLHSAASRYASDISAQNTQANIESQQLIQKRQAKAAIANTVANVAGNAATNLLTRAFLPQQFNRR